MSKPTLCLDFDGVIHSYASGWQGALCIPDPPVPGAIAFIVEAMETFEVAIYSTRSNAVSGPDAMAQWLRFWASKELTKGQVEQLMECVVWPTEKPSAFVTLDDRAITFTGAWPALQTLREFKPWNKQ